MSVTLADLQTRVRTRADMRRSQFISDNELTVFIQASYEELYDLLTVTDEDYYTVSTTFSITSGNTFPLPADFYKLRGLDKLRDSSDKYDKVRAFEFESRNMKSTDFAGPFADEANVRYRIIGASGYFIPTDKGAGNYRMWYVPRGTTLSASGDTVDGINGWEEYIVIDAAIKCLTVEESDTTALMLAKDAMKRRIQQMGANRDYANPEVIHNVQDPTQYSIGLNSFTGL